MVTVQSERGGWLPRVFVWLLRIVIVFRYWLRCDEGGNGVVLMDCVSVVLVGMMNVC